MKKNQKQLILDYIQQYGSITNAEAVTDLGIGRLAARVEELRKQGYPIATVMEQGKNRRDEPVVYARYIIGLMN